MKEPEDSEPPLTLVVNKQRQKRLRSRARRAELLQKGEILVAALVQGFDGSVWFACPVASRSYGCIRLPRRDHSKLDVQPQTVRHNYDELRYGSYVGSFEISGGGVIYIFNLPRLPEKWHLVSAAVARRNCDEALGRILDVPVSLVQTSLPFFCQALLSRGGFGPLAFEG